MDYHNDHNTCNMDHYNGVDKFVDSLAGSNSWDSEQNKFQ